MNMQAIGNWLRFISTVIAALSAIFGLPVALLLLLLSPIDQRVDRNTAELADHAVELVRQGREQAHHDTQLAMHGAEVVGLKTELARQGNEQVRQVDKFDALSRDFLVFSGEVNVRFARIDLLLETMDASKLPISALPVEQSDSANVSVGGVIWRISGSVDSPEFSGPNSVRTFCAAMI